MTNATATHAEGKIVQCIGAVVDVEFPRDAMPKIYDALKMVGTPLTLEVQQQLGDGVVRTIALGSSDGLRRGLTVTNTDKPLCALAMLLMSSIMLTVLPTPAPPNRPTLPPLANGHTKSITLIPVSSKSWEGLNSSYAGGLR